MPPPDVRSITLGQVLDDVGRTLIEGVIGDLDPGQPVHEVVIYDGPDEPVAGALVLGVGLHDRTTIAQTRSQLAAAGAVGLVIREPLASLAGLNDRSPALPVLALTPGAAWSQVAAVLRSVLIETRDTSPDAPTLGGLALGDLFGAANSLAALIGAPITIEDRRAQVLAFSAGQHEADQSRIESVLGRQVPETTLQTHTSKGVFRELYASDGPIWIDARPDTTQTLARTAIAVRAGSEVLGSIWVAVREPLAPARLEALTDGAQLLALHLLHHRAGADNARHTRTRLVGEALAGGPMADEAAARLGLPPGPVLVATLATRRAGAAFDDDGASTTNPVTTTNAATLTAQQRRLADAFAVHLEVVISGSVVAQQGDVAFALIPARMEDPQAVVVRVAEEFLRRVGAPHHPVVAVGSPVPSPADLPVSREQALRVLRVLRSPRTSARVASLRQVATQAALTELLDLMRARDEDILGSLGALQEHDAKRDGRLVETLRAWLEAFGDVNAAADALYVHPNTFRYRLRRAARIAGIDLSDPDDRFTALLRLRLANL